MLLVSSAQVGATCLDGLSKRLPLAGAKIFSDLCIHVGALQMFVQCAQCAWLSFD